jgi:O-acetyl-ADP-ribose deacetylase (regulator of RNase III)
MKYKKGNLLDGDWDVAMHCANIECVMGSGIAYYLKEKWPEVYQADLDYHDNLMGSSMIAQKSDKLGRSSVAILPDNRLVINLYGQVGIGNDGHPLNRNCRYDYLYDAIYRACDRLCKLESPFTIGIPYGMASVRAGGSWIIVEAILKDIESKFPVEFIIYDIDNGEMKPTEKVQSSVYIPL